VLDFMNDVDTIKEAFEDYYRTMILAAETDPDKLHDLKGALDAYHVYAPEQIDELVALYLTGADRDKPDPILNACVAVYREQLDEDGQVDFKGKAKAFTRTYGFLSSVLPYGKYAEGRVFHFSELPRAEAAGPDRRGPVERHSRNADDTELFKQFVPFRRWRTDTVFGMTYDAPASTPAVAP
jgi:type I site-specific restriction-modification system R (restriction) subunit